MNAQIDPYLDWLQIPADRRPPTHYDLLGLPAFQADAASAQAAAMRRSAHVRKFQLVHGELTVRLMGEIARALTCLSDPVSKRQYDAGLRGAATLIEESVGMDTQLEEPLTAEEQDYGLEPLSPELGGSSPNTSLEKLTALADQIAPPPQPELQPTGLLGAATAERPQVQGPALELNRRTVVIVAGVLAATLLFLALGWMLSGSKNSNQAADASGPSQPPEAPSPALASEPPVPSPAPRAEPGAGEAPAVAPSPAAAPPSLIVGQQSQWSGSLVDLYLSSDSRPREVHLLLRFAPGANGLVEAVSDDANLMIGLNDYPTELETGGNGSTVMVMGLVEALKPQGFADLSGSSRIRLSSIQRQDDPASLVFANNTAPRPAISTIVDQLTFLHRLRPPYGMPIEFEALFQGLERSNGSNTVVLKAAGADTRTVPLHFDDPQVRIPIEQHYRPGDRVTVKASVTRSEHPGRLELNGKQMQKSGDARTTVGGTPLAYPQASEIMSQWNAFASAPHPGLSAGDLAAGMLSLLATNSPRAPSPEIPVFAPVPVPMPPAPEDPGDALREQGYLAYIVPRNVTGIVTTSPEATILAHGIPFSPEDFALVAQADRQVLRKQVYHVFRIPNSGPLRIKWTGLADDQVLFSYWNGQRYQSKSIVGARTIATHELNVDRPPGEPFVYVMINGANGSVFTDQLVFQATRPALAGPSAPIAPPVEGIAQEKPAEDPQPAETFQTAYDQLDTAIDKASKDKKSAESKWAPVLAQLAALELAAQDDSQRKAVKRMRRRLADVADRLLIEANAERKDFALYQKYLREAVLLDPTGDAGRKGQLMLNKSRGLGF